MPSSKSYLDFILEQLSPLSSDAAGDPASANPGTDAYDAASAVTFRPMIGEYILYYRGKIFGGIYDDRLLVKPVKSAAAMMPHAVKELPYEGAKPMLLADNVDDADFLTALVRAMYEELPEPKPKTKRGKGKK